MPVLPLRLTPTDIHTILPYRRMWQPMHLWTLSGPTPDGTLRVLSGQ